MEVLDLKAMAEEYGVSYPTIRIRLDQLMDAVATDLANEIHNIPGKNPNCAASTGPTSGPGPAIAAK